MEYHEAILDRTLFFALKIDTEMKVRSLVCSSSGSWAELG